MNCTANASKFSFPHVEPLLDKVFNDAKPACVELLPTLSLTFLPFEVLPAISSSLNITLVNSVSKCTGPVIWGFVSIPWILALIAAETWCGLLTSARGSLELLLGMHGPLEAVLCGSCLLTLSAASKQSGHQ